MFRRLLVLTVSVLLLTSCHESFNSIYEEVEEHDPNVVPPEVIDLKNVNILPTLSDPLYMIDETRSWVGPFGNFDADKAHWLSTRFCVYGLLTHNRLGGEPDYAAAMNGNRHYGVLWDQRMGISDQQGHTIFYDENDKPVICKYNPDEKLYRYKFFLLGTDGLEHQPRVEGTNRLVARMELDGSNDIMHSFAYHTDRQYNEEVAQLPNDETTKVFTDGGKEYMYNRLSGNRGLHPIFNVNHLMSRFDIYVKGGNPQNNRSCDFLKVFVTNVSIEAAKTIDVTVADDNWERDAYITQFQENKLFSVVGQPSWFELQIVDNEMKNNEFTIYNRADMDFDSMAKEAEEYSRMFGVDVIPEGSHWVSDIKRDSLCKTILLPPYPTLVKKQEDSSKEQEGSSSTAERSFVLKFSYRYLNMHYDQSTGKYHLGEKSGDQTQETLWEDFKDVKIVIPNTDENGDPVKYIGGHKYSIVITVYGKSSIVVDMLRPTMWEDGGDIEAGKE